MTGLQGLRRGNKTPPPPIVNMGYIHIHRLKIDIWMFANTIWWQFTHIALSELEIPVITCNCTKPGWGLGAAWKGFKGGGEVLKGDGDALKVQHDNFAKIWHFFNAVNKHKDYSCVSKLYVDGILLRCNYSHYRDVIYHRSCLSVWP